MIWSKIEAAAAMLEKVSPSLDTFVRVLGEHLKRKHGKQVEAGPKPKSMGAYLLASAGCAARRIVLGQDECVHSVGPHGLP